MAGIAGIEPTHTESKSVVLPLDYIPIYSWLMRERPLVLTNK